MANIWGNNGNLENPVDRGAWWDAVHRVIQSWTRLKQLSMHACYMYATLEKEMAAHSSVLAWRIPGTEKPGGLLSMGSHRVQHDWNDLAAAMETVTDFIFLGSKITADGNCSHEIKRCLLFGRKAMINIDSILKSRDITLPTKVHLVKAMAFSGSHVWMWE